MGQVAKEKKTGAINKRVEPIKVKLLFDDRSVMI
jgi:hypothetical protein